jgi:ubiquinone/menaquinone biosynthesis C-methylase UbiE
MVLMTQDPVWTHFSTLAEEGVWATLYKPGVQLTSENSSFIVRARRVMELLRSSGKKPVQFLDVGCGTAPLGPAIVAMGSNYTGVDFSPEMIDAARGLMSASIESGEVRLSVGDATNLELPPATFDCTVAMGLVEYFTRGQVDKVLQEIARVTAPGGIVIVTVPKKWHWGKLIDLILTPFRKMTSWRPRAGNVSLRRREAFRRLLMTPSELDGAARRAGLKPVDSRHYNTQIVSGPLLWLFPRFSYLVNRPFEFLSLIPVGSFFSTGYIGMYVRE